jgi:hypothetical protein
MTTERDPPDIPDEMSPEGAGQYLSRFLGWQDLDEQRKIDDELATE